MESGAVKRIIWRALQSLIDHCPERLRVLMKQSTLHVNMDYPGIQLVVESEADYGERRHSSAKEPETIRWIEESMRAGDVFIDIGANVGAYSLVAAKKHQQQVRVYAFEPAAPNYFNLCRNISLNGFGECIFPFPIALSNETSLGVFNYASLRPGDALHAFGASVDLEGKPFTPAFRQQMISYRLDDFIQQFGLPWPTHIKLDVDGIELKVLQGAEQTLTHIRSLVMELEHNDPETDQIRAYLAAHGLTYRSHYPTGSSGRYSRIDNCIFERAAL